MESSGRVSEFSLALRVWAVTLALVVAAGVAIFQLVGTGGPRLCVAAGALFLCYVSVQAWRSGGRFEIEEGLRASGQSRLGDAPEIQRALLSVCERAGRPIPEVALVRMDAPGAKVGYDDGDPLLAVDPRLPTVVGPAG